MPNEVRPYPLSDADVLTIQCALSLMEALLFKSRYPDDLKLHLAKHILRLSEVLVQVRSSEVEVPDDFTGDDAS